jgi:hypothetical protein
MQRVEIEVTETGQDGAPVPGATFRVRRRALLAAGAGGAALSLLPLLSGGASASTDDSTPPKHPTDADDVLLGQAQQLELAAVALYDEALAVEGWTEAQATAVTFIREAHEAYAQALSGLLGRAAPGTRNDTLFLELQAAFGGAPADVLAAAYDLESAAVATHLEILGAVEGTDGSELVAAILSNEARFCTVLADLNGLTDTADLLVDVEAEPLVSQG